ncbi:hypothetical protein BST97_04725 [Nonlabens spongiae]|uniref:Uncharacterized protein n=1 Tax=Nonlabens spongiae TaxID=331648 RepID=A0A1W6MIB3_9FLAO|nr:hypothetical protein [Nonlabens spongiae]ARN77341.1 hypothetical protein BST97_04725 [Nonlabens spongiae]
MKENSKSVIVFLSALSLAILIPVIFVAFNFGSNLCSQTAIQEFHSPNHLHKIVLSQMNCGTTTDFTTEIHILESDEIIENEEILFQAFSDNLVAQFEGVIDIEVEWLTDEKIIIKFDKKARNFELDKSLDGFKIKYQRF